ncbi:hypothetical protein [Ahniella affigens]|uniref:hypothetical protein n=1 Tax=Ahniella affigens TaxID=2021234 RepID=UPI0011B209C5|nr:hypothetical protein [Ahniella affigens]
MEFVTAVGAADAANIKMDTSLHFQRGWRRSLGFGLVDVRLFVLPHCLDARLATFLADAVLTRQANEHVPDGEDLLLILARYSELLPNGSRVFEPPNV